MSVSMYECEITHHILIPEGVCTGTSLLACQVENVNKWLQEAGLASGLEKLKDCLLLANYIILMRDQTVVFKNT